ncbi:MAG: dienelactone hydrolase family protein [Xanthobacteraceae bacterium]
MQTERIKYPMGALTAEGALIYDENVSGKRPAVLLAPNWMGVTDTAIQRGELVAENRYVVFVADMYGAGTRPADFGEAAALANPLRADAIEQRSRVKAAFETMIAQAQKRSLIDDRRAAVGFCFGGGNVLELARDGADLAAAVSIHGDLKTALPAGKGTLKAALLVAHGALDPVAKGRPGRFRSGNECRWCEMADGDLFRGSAGLYRSGRGRPRGSLPGTNRRRGRPTRSPINSWLMPSRHDCELRMRPRGRPGLRAWKPLTVGWVPGDRAAGLVTADVQNCLGIRVARCSFRHAVTRSAVTFLRVS